MEKFLNGRSFGTYFVVQFMSKLASCFKIYMKGLVKWKQLWKCCILNYRSGSNFGQIKGTCDPVKKLLRQLEAQGEVVSNHRTFIQQIISKFPAEVIIKFEETKGDPTNTAVFERSPLLSCDST